MPGIGVILNPNSKKYKKNPDKTHRMGFIVGDKASCKATEDLQDLRRVAEEFKTRDIDILAISGGDGTNHCTLTTFLQVYGEKPLPRIAFLRGGTLNTVASTLGIKGSSEKLLSNLLVKYHEDIPFQTKEATLLKINNEYGFLWGIGVLYNFLDAYYSNREIVSPFIAAKTLFRSIGSAFINGRFARALFDRFDGEVIVNGKRWPFANYAAVYAGMINQLGFDFRVFYLTDQFPDRFHAIGFSSTPRDLIRYVPKMYLGKPSGCPNLLEEAATEMVVQLTKPLPFMIDGDMKKPIDRWVITQGPKITLILS